MPDFRGDQAAGLRRLLGGERQRIVTFAAASEGVGKTHVVANLAAALVQQGKSVLVVDENAAQDNVAGWFGTTSGHDLLDVLQGRRSLISTLIEPEPGLRILPAARAVNAFAQLGGGQRDAFLAALSGPSVKPDVILIDAAHDHPQGFSPFGLASPETVVVLSATAAAITAGYALVKRVSASFGRRHFRVLVNKVRNAAEAERVYGNLARVSSQRAVATLGFAGYVPADESMGYAARSMRSVLGVLPDSPAALAFRALAADLLYWPTEDKPEGLEQFMAQLLHFSQRIVPGAVHAR